MTFDFPNSALYLEIGKQYDRIFPLKYESGLRFNMAAGNLIVEYADEEGLAYKAGVRSGQRVLEIDGRDARDMTPYTALLLVSNLRDGLPLKIAFPGKTPRVVRIYGENGALTVGAAPR